jgi:hypothetical protein
MKTLHPTWLLVAIFVVLSLQATQKLTAAPIAGPILNPATGHLYYLLENSNWTDAQAESLGLGGNLVTINDAAENAWVSQTFTNSGGVQRNLWIGLNAVGADGGNASNYGWVDGSSSAYRNWAPLEPNYSDQYVYILPGGLPNAGKWNNVGNVTSAGYQSYPAIPNYGVAEVVPEPATYLSVLLGSLLFFQHRSRRIVN